MHQLWVYQALWLRALWGVAKGEDHSLTLEVSQDVQNGVQLQTETFQLSALVLSQTLPALHL